MEKHRKSWKHAEKHSPQGPCVVILNEWLLPPGTHVAALGLRGMHGRLNGSRGEVLHWSPQSGRAEVRLVMMMLMMLMMVKNNYDDLNDLGL